MAATTRPKNWLLIQFRQWHGWLGTVLSLLIVLVCLSGIYLNHKDLFAPRQVPAGATGKAPAESARKPPVGGLTTTTDLSRLAIDLPGALRMARELWGDVPLEKVEIKHEKGTLVYKVNAGQGREVLVDADSGTTTVKGPTGPPTPGQAAQAGVDWGKFIKDLHTGKLGGLAGKLLVDLTAVVVMVLTLSGLYLFIVPKLRQRRAQARAAAAAAQSTVQVSVPASSS
jgi:hypothetical protein